jgi:hypothetical protein
VAFLEAIAFSGVSLLFMDKQASADIPVALKIELSHV